MPLGGRRSLDWEKFFLDNKMEHYYGIETLQGFSRTSLAWKRWQHVLVYFVHLMDQH